MKRFAMTIVAATLAILPFCSHAQSAAQPPASASTAPLPVPSDEGMPPLPPLSADQSQQVRGEMDAYRRETDARVARGEITPDEAQRLLQWREWQLAQQAAGLAPVPPPSNMAMSPPPYPAPPPRYYYPYPYPYYYPAPYYGPYYAPLGISVCAGRAWHHGFGSFCI